MGKATRVLIAKRMEFKYDLLFQHGINFNDLPAWKRRGTGSFFVHYSDPCALPDGAKQ